MKFAKVLSAQATSVLPGGLQTLFPYKAFKKHISNWAAQCYAAAALGAHAGACGAQEQQQHQQQLAMCQRELLRMLSAELQRLNQTLMEREELLVMSWQVLEEEAASAMQPQSQQPSVDHQHLQDLLQLLVNFHGDAVMLLNWSHVNFSAVVKALKKFDKRTGSCLRTPLTQHVLCQPFCSTDVITRLTHSAEGMVSRLTAQLQPPMMPDTTVGPIEALHAHTMPTAAASHGSPTSAAAASFISVAPSSRKRAHRQMACGFGSGGCCEEQIAECAVMSSRIRAALDTWRGLACSAHTPSTCVAAVAANAAGFSGVPGTGGANAAA